MNEENVKKPDALAEAISHEISVQLKGDLLPRLVEEQLTKGVTKILEDLFGWNGAVSNVIKEKFKEVMVPTFEHHDYSEYLLKLDVILTEIINMTSLKDNKQILENFKTLMTEPVEKIVNVSTIYEKWMDYVARNVDTDGLEAECEYSEPYYENVDVAMEVDFHDKMYSSSYKDATVFFRCEHDEKMNYELRLFKNKDAKEWTILKTTGESNLNSLARLDDFYVYMLSLDRNFSKVILDVTSDSSEVTPEEKPEWSLS
jgi:hypothetical protein